MLLKLWIIRCYPIHCSIKELPLEVLEDILLKAKNGNLENDLKLARANEVSKQFYNAFETNKMKAFINAVRLTRANIDPTSYGRFGMWMPEGCGYH